MKTVSIKTVLRGIAKGLKKGGEDAFLMGDFAVDVDGNSVKPTSKKAVQWCALGIGYRDFGAANTKRANKHFEKIIGQSIDEINDGEGLDSIVGLLRKAATRTKPLPDDQKYPREFF